MSDFKVKMHQIRFRLGFRPRPRWGNREGGEGREGRGKGRGEDPLVLAYTPWYEIPNETRLGQTVWP